MAELADLFLRFVRPHRRRLFAVARRYVADVHDAQDLVQETLARAWRGFSPNEDRAYHRGWLFVILRNVAAEWARSAGRRVRLVTLSQSELTDVAPIDLTEPLAALPAWDDDRFRQFLDERVAAALDALEPRFREVVILSVAGDLSYREIADVLDCPVGTVMSRMARARRALREKLADYAASRGLTAEGRR